MMKKKIAVIGNAPAGQILTLMLKDSCEIIRVVDCEERKRCVPFYANDIEKGILKQFCGIAGIPFQTPGRGERKVHIVFGEGKRLCCDSSLLSFQKALEEGFPEHREAIERLFLDIKDIGEEWSRFIQNNFNAAGGTMKKSARYACMTVSRYLEKAGMSRSDLREILYTILPVCDVTFSVFAGYLYTQFFDSHVLSQDLWTEISIRAKRLGTEVFADDLENIVVEEEGSKQKDGDILENMDGVVDFRCCQPADQRSDNTNKWIWAGLFSSDQLDENVLYHLKMCQGGVIRFWKSLYLAKREENEWQFEILIEKSCHLNAEMVSDLAKRQIRECFKADIEVKSVYGPDYFASHYDTPCGYMWAFSPGQSGMDPTYLYKRQNIPCIKMGYWGFAWFSAAFCAYNILSRQIEWKGRYRLVLR